jgi:O-antigen/teichoic acid export membrane protein/glycosyltransferase involved in cell wall biosynthesis
MSVSGKIARNSFFQFWGILLTVGSSLILSIALARKLGPDQYGTYSFAVWLIGLGALLSNLGVASATTRFVAEYMGSGDRRGLQWVVRATLRGRIFVAVPMALIMIPVAMVLVGDRSGTERFYPLLISLGLVPYALHQAFQGTLKGFQRYDYSTFALVLGLLLKAVIAVALVWLGYGILHLLTLEALVWALAAVLGFLFLRRLVQGPFSKPDSGQSQEAKKNLTRYAAIASFLILVDFIINDRSEMFFLGLFRPDADVGYYSLAFAMSAYPIMLIPGALGSVLMPIISEQFGRGDSTRLEAIYRTSARYLMMLSFPLAAGGIVMARPLVLALFGSEYTAMVVPTQILFAARSTFAVSMATSSVIWGTNRPQFFLFLSIFLVPVNIIACLLLIPLFGMEGAALAQLAGGPALVATLWYVTTRLHVAWPYMDSARIIVASTVMAVGVTLLQGYLDAPGLIPVVILLGAALYFALLVAFRALRGEDMRLVGALWSRVGLPGRLASSWRRLQRVEPRREAESVPALAVVDLSNVAEAGTSGAVGARKEDAMENSKPKVSVYIPTYNYGRFLGEAIQSVLDQTFPDWELIVVDDGSTDDTREVVESFADPRIHYVYQENQGNPAARNTALRMVRGEYIACLDGDDIWLPEKLEKQVAQLDALPPAVGLVYSDLYLFNDGDDTITGRFLRGRKPPRGRVLAELLPEKSAFIVDTVALIRREVFDKVGLYDEKLQTYEDWEMWVRMANSYEVEALDEPLARFRRHASSLSADVEKMYRHGHAAKTKVMTSYSLTPNERRALRGNLAYDAYCYGVDQLRLGRRGKAWMAFFRAVRLRPGERKTYVHLGLPLISQRLYGFLYKSYSSVKARFSPARQI